MRSHEVNFDHTHSVAAYQIRVSSLSLQRSFRHERVESLKGMLGKVKSSFTPRKGAGIPAESAVFTSENAPGRVKKSLEMPRQQIRMFLCDGGILNCLSRVGRQRLRRMRRPIPAADRVALRCTGVEFPLNDSVPMASTPFEDDSQDDLLTEEWFTQLCQGDGDAVNRLWELYFQRMVVAARRKLDGSNRADRDEEDIALSAFKSFCLGIREGRIRRRDDDGNLWPLLLRLTLNKAVDQIRRNNRKKRGGSGNETADVNTKKVAVPVADLIGGEPSPEMAAAASESFALLLQTLEATGDEDLKPIALASFEGNSPSETANELRCSVRTVQRKLKTIHTLWLSLQ